MYSNCGTSFPAWPNSWASHCFTSPIREASDPTPPPLLFAASLTEESLICRWSESTCWVDSMNRKPVCVSLKLNLLPLRVQTWRLLLSALPFSCVVFLTPFGFTETLIWNQKWKTIIINFFKIMYFELYYSIHREFFFFNLILFYQVYLFFTNFSLFFNLNYIFIFLRFKNSF